MKLLICGDRNWADSTVMYQVILKFLTDNHVDIETTEIITGGARGADTLAHQVTGFMGCMEAIVHADWHRYGRSAGPIRNRKMLDMKPDFVIAFHDSIGNSKGTKDCVKEAFNRGIPVYVYTHENGLGKLEACSF